MDQEYICYLPTGRYRIEKHFAVSLDLEWTAGLRPQAKVGAFKTKGKFCLATDRPRPINKIFLFPLMFLL